MLILDLLLGAVVMTLWYFCLVRYNRRKALVVLRWIGAAFSGNGQILGMQWQGTSRFDVRLRISSNLFHRVRIQVRLKPREIPLQWLLTRLRKEPETLTFEADLVDTPDVNLQVQTHRWCGRTAGKLSADPNAWSLEQFGPFVITTRKDWQREVGTMMNALSASRQCEFLSVSFRQESPNFSATMPLQAISPDMRDADLFNALRELAAGASASRF